MVLEKPHVLYVCLERKYLYTIVAVVVVVVLVSAFEIPSLEKPKQTLPLSQS